MDLTPKPPSAPSRSWSLFDCCRPSSPSSASATSSSDRDDNEEEEEQSNEDIPSHKRDQSHEDSSAPHHRVVRFELPQSASEGGDGPSSLPDDEEDPLRLRKELAEVASERDGLRATKDAMQNKMDAMQADLEKMRGDDARHVAEHAVLREALASAQTSASDVEDERHRLSVEVDSIRTEMVDISAERVEILAQKGAMQRRIDSLELENEGEVARLKEILLCTSGVRDDLSVENASLREQLNASRAEAAGGKVTMGNLRMELELARERIVELSTQSNDAWAENAKLDEDNVNLKKELQEVRSCLFDVTTTWGEPKGELSAENNDDLKDQIENLQSDVSQISAMRDELSAKNDTLQKKIGSISAAREEEAGHLQRELELAQIECDVSKKGIIKQLSNELAEHQSRMKVAENSIGSLSAQLNSVQKERDKLNEEITMRLDEMIKQKELEIGMAQQIESLTSEVEHGNENVTAIRAELNRANLAASQMQEQLNIKVETLESCLLESKESIAVKVTEIESLQKELDTFQKSAAGVIMNRDLLLVRQSGSLVAGAKKADIANSDASFLEEIFSVPPTENLSSEITVHGFSHQGLSVDFKCTKDVLDRQASVIVAKFTNTTDAPLERLHLQVAVPKYVTMEMKPPTSSTVPVMMWSSTVEVTQTIRVTNTMMGTKNLRLKLNVSFASKGMKVEHMATCSGFPPGQF